MSFFNVQFLLIFYKYAIYRKNKKAECIESAHHLYNIGMVLWGHLVARFGTAMLHSKAL